LAVGNYKDIDRLAQENGFGPVDGILLDLGFSSLQLDDPERGFSFQSHGPLDMRYSKANRLTARTVVNHYQQKDLERIIREFGEEHLAKAMSRAIVEARQVGELSTTDQLAVVITKVLPGKIRHKAQDSLRRVFQAIRIEVNSELSNIKTVLPKALDLLAPKGRLVVISFHSLEDRIVKEFFKDQAKDCVCPPEFPTCVCDKASRVRILTRKPVTASEEEGRENPRSKSAKLRAIEKI
jgi:16S rRNA (cytosine1402-N4)-methyltransferase